MNDNADGRDEWANLGFAAKSALVCGGTITTIGLFSMGPALPEIQKAFASTANAGLLVQIIGGMVAPAFAVASPLAGRMVERFGIRTVYLASLVLFLIGGLGAALCNSLLAMLPFRLVLALGVAGGITAAYAGIARVPEPQRPMLLGMMSFIGGGIAMFAFPIVGNLAVESWRLAFLIHLALVPIGTLAFALPKGGRVVHARTEQPAAPSGMLGGVPILTLLVAAIGGWGFVASSIYSPVFLGSIGVSDAGEVGKVLMVMAGCSLLGSGSYGFVHRLFGTRIMLLLGLGFAGAACVVIGSNTALIGVIIGLGMFGMGLSVFAAAVFADAIEAIGSTGNAGAAMGVMNLALFGPQILFPVFATTVGGAAGPAMVFFMLAGLFALCVVLVLIRKRGTPPAALPSGSLG